MLFSYNYREKQYSAFAVRPEKVSLRTCSLCLQKALNRSMFFACARSNNMRQRARRNGKDTRPVLQNRYDMNRAEHPLTDNLQIGEEDA